MVRFRCQRIIYSSLPAGNPCKYGCRLPAGDTRRLKNSLSVS